MSKYLGFLSNEERKDFWDWAIGYVPKGMSLKVMDDWNKFHGDELWLRPDELIYESLDNMYALFSLKSKPLKKKAPSRKKKNTTKL